MRAARSKDEFAGDASRRTSNKGVLADPFWHVRFLFFLEDASSASVIERSKQGEVYVISSADQDLRPTSIIF